MRCLWCEVDRGWYSLQKYCGTCPQIPKLWFINCLAPVKAQQDEDQLQWLLGSVAMYFATWYVDVSVVPPYRWLHCRGNGLPSVKLRGTGHLKEERGAISLFKFSTLSTRQWLTHFVALRTELVLPYLTSYRDYGKTATNFSKLNMWKTRRIIQWKVQILLSSKNLTHVHTLMYIQYIYVGKESRQLRIWASSGGYFNDKLQMIYTI